MSEERMDGVLMELSAHPIQMGSFYEKRCLIEVDWEEEKESKNSYHCLGILSMDAIEHCMTCSDAQLWFGLHGKDMKLLVN